MIPIRESTGDGNHSMHDPLQPGPLEELESSGRHHHRRKKKRHHSRKMARKIIIFLLFIAVCVIALTAWHFLVQEPAPRSGMPPPRPSALIKA